jgi:hypothetical protein
MDNNKWLDERLEPERRDPHAWVDVVVWLGLIGLLCLVAAPWAHWFVSH